MRKVMVTDSALSLMPATAFSIRRRSGLFSAQNPASASSLSKIGTSSHFAIARMFNFHIQRRARSDAPSLASQHLIKFSLVEEPFLRLEWPGENNPELLAVGAINT